MRKPTKTHSKDGSTAIWLLELSVYALFVFAYYFLVLHFLGAWLKGLFDKQRAEYAVVALSLMLAQGGMLELLTGWLFSKLRPKAK